MRKTPTITIALCSLAVLSCLLVLIITLVTRTPNLTDTDISLVTVTLERGPCFGTCPVYTVAVQGTGQVNFVGVRNTAETESTYQISDAEFARLWEKVQAINFFSFRDEYINRLITDLPTTSITVSLGDTQKTIEMYGPGVPQDLIDLAELIDEVAATESLINRSDI